MIKSPPRFSAVRRPPRSMPIKCLIKSPPAASGPLENIKTGGEDPSQLSGAIGYVKTLGSSPPLLSSSPIYYLPGIRRSLLAGDLTFGSVKKSLLILFLPSCKTVRHKSKVTGRENQRLQWKNSNYSCLFLPTKFKLKFGSLSKGWIFDAQCRKVLEVAKKVIRNKTNNFARCITANANIAWNTSTTNKLAKQS